MVSKAVNIGLRVWELLCAVIVTSLIGNMIATAFAGNSAMVNYSMFAAVFALLTLFYLVPTSIMESFSFPIVNMVFDGLNVLFWFVAAVALPAYLGVHSCSNLGYTRTNHITNGSPNTKKRCHEAQASVAFFWFGWVAFVLSFALSIMNGRGNVNMRGGLRRGPAMSQV